MVCNLWLCSIDSSDTTDQLRSNNAIESINNAITSMNLLTTHQLSSRSTLTLMLPHTGCIPLSNWFDDFEGWFRNESRNCWMHLAQLGHILVCIITRTTKLNLACFWTCCATNERTIIGRWWSRFRNECDHADWKHKQIKINRPLKNVIQLAR